MKQLEVHHVCHPCSAKLTEEELAGAVESDGLRLLRDPLRGERCEKCGEVPRGGTLSYAFDRNESAT